MENNEIMNAVETEEFDEVVYEDGQDNGMGVGMLVGATLMGVGIAAFNWGKKKWAEHKAKKTEGVVKFEKVEAKTADEEVEVK